MNQMSDLPYWQPQPPQRSSINAPKPAPSIPLAPYPVSSKQEVSFGIGSSATNARVALGVIGALVLVAGIIVLILSFNVTPAIARGFTEPTAAAILDATHTALIMMITGSLVTLIGSIAVIALLAVWSIPTGGHSGLSNSAALQNLDKPAGATRNVLRD